jgi:NADPH:quinone reductase-like Zn-dependent oxidoreductase
MAGDVRPGARAVRFDRYGGTDELYLADVAMPVAGPGRVVVEVRATAVNPGESAIRRGLLHDRFPATFPSGQGSDLAGVVVAVGPDVADVEVGAEVLGWSWERSAHATHVAVPVTQLIARPPELPWTVAGALYVISAAATAAIAAVEPQPGETVVVSAAAGGVGSLVVQLLARRGVSVLAIASPQRDDWLRAHGAVPVHRGDRLGARLQAAAPRGIDAVIDLFGPEYVQLGIDLGVARDRIETIIAFAAAQEHGTRSLGSEDATSTGTLSATADLVAAGRLEVPIAGTYPLHEVAAAFDELEQRRTHGKIVLLP